MNNILIIYALFNILTFILFGIDKRKAIKDKWRISEKTLLICGLFGGFGQFFGMKVFHHKTLKWYFKISSVVFPILQIVVLIFVYTKCYM